MATLHVSVVSAEESIFEGEAEFVAVPSETGELGILPRHTPLIARIKPGAVRIKLPNSTADTKDELVFVNGGIVEIQPKVVTVLADTAIRGKDLDEAKALEAKKRAEELLANHNGDVDYAHAQGELAMAVAQLSALRRLKNIH